MTAILRDCSPELDAALFDGSIVAEADLITLFDADGNVLHRGTSWDRDLPFDGHVFAAGKPWVECTGWEVVNTMTVPTMNIALRAGDGPFNGGPSLRVQVNQGLLDGASLLLSQAYLVRAADPCAPLVVLDSLDVFSGKTAGVDLDGMEILVAVKGKSNDLDQQAPRNLYQTSCNLAFCSAGCTLSRAAFTASYVMGSAPSTTFIPWASVPGSPARYQSGTLVVTSGSDAGARRAIDRADAAGLTLAYPLRAIPAAGDGFTAFEGCDKSYNSGSVQSCTARSNTQHHRGFDFVPPPTTSV